MDWIRDTVIDQASRLGLTAYAVAQKTGIEYSTVNRYLTGKCSLNSRYLSLICTALELELKPVKSTPLARLRNVNRESS
jgi:transcriptional regulator with XRE-family HTH domain